MNKTHKLYKGEIKKFFYNPIIFVIIGVFAILFVVLPSIFNPSQKKDVIYYQNYDTSSVLAIQNSFLRYKNEYENQNADQHGSLSNLINSPVDFNQLSSLAEEFFQLRLKFSEATNRELIEGENGCFNLQIQMINKLNEIESLYNSYKTSYIIPLSLADEKCDFDLTNNIIVTKRLLDSSNSNKTISYYNELEVLLDSYASASKLKNDIKNLQFLEYQPSNLQKILDDYYNQKDYYKASILQDMQAILTKAQGDEKENVSQNNRNQMLLLAKHYLSTCLYTYQTINNATILELTKNYSNEKINNFVGFENFNRYQIMEELSTSKYLLQNASLSEDYASPFSFNSNSTTQTNAFDYVYFCLEILTIAIIIFSVITCSMMIAKEQSDGTIKLLAIKPYKRHKIISSKIGATFTISLILMLVSFVVSLITGFIMFGTSMPNMLITINASLTFSLPVLIVMLIYLVLLAIKIYVYILLASAISVIFRSFVGAVCVSSAIYIINLITTFVSNGANWLRFNLFSHLDLFKYFGGSFINLGSPTKLTQLFYSPVFAGTNIFVSLSVVAIFIVILNALTYTIFRKRDI